MANQAQKTKSYHHGRLRESLIEAGVTILEEEGIHALSLRKVAKRAEVSHAAPYRHFDDKVALLAAIAERGFRQLADGMQQALAATDKDARQRLFGIGYFYVSFGIDHPAQLTLMFSDLLKESGCDSLMNAATYTFDLLVSSVEAAQQAGVIKAGDSAEIASAVWSLEHGLAMLMKEGFFVDEESGSTNQAVTNALEHMLTGLAP